MKRHLLVFLLLSYAMTMVAQQQPRKTSANPCSTDRQEALRLQDPAYAAQKRKRSADYKSAMIELTKRKKSGLQSMKPPIYTIPTVVHIFHSGTILGSVANPSDDQVQSVMAESSERFRHNHSGARTYTNPNYGADAEIEFCLASKDPDGNYTTGIIRHYNPGLAIFDLDSDDLSSDYLNDLWPIARYNNVVIVETLLGAAGVYFSGVDATFYDSGAYWSGLVAHELGHYFDLAHTFSGGCTNGDCLSDGDGVCDTPPKSEPGYLNGTCIAPDDSCDTDEDDTSNFNPYRPTSNGGVGNQPDMLDNYMDYTGGCWDAFTLGQKDRMRNNIENFRVELTNAAGCEPSTTPANDAGITIIEQMGSPCQELLSLRASLRNYGTATLSSVDIVVEANGVIVLNYSWVGSLSSGAGLDVGLPAVDLAAGSYLIKVETKEPNALQDGFANNDAAYMTYSGEGSLPLDIDFDDTNVITVINPDASTTWTYRNALDRDCSGSPDAVAVLDNYNYQAPDQRDHLRLSLVDLTAFSSATLSFYVAYAPFTQNQSETLEVEVSNQCGQSAVVYSKSGLDLATNNPPAYSSDLFRPACTEWRQEIIDLSGFTGAGFDQVIIDLVNINQYGNIIYIDDITLVGENNCNSILLVEDEISSGVQSFSASSYISLSSRISGASTEVICSGGEYVELIEGFEVTQGSIFSADGEGCN